MAPTRRRCVELMVAVVLWTTLVSDVSGQVQPLPDFSALMNSMLEDWFNVKKYPPIQLSLPELGYFQDLLRKINVSDPGAPGPTCRTRVEFRLMSLVQFKNFSDAMVTLYNKVIDEDTGRTVYQLFTGYHRVTMAPGAHGGPCFGTWHAIFLILIEIALQEVNPTVCIPLNDWRADFSMINHCQSSLYTPQYYGNGMGPVLTGFSKGWKVYPATECGGTPLGQPLLRACQPFQNLITGVSYAEWERLYDTYTDYPDLCSPWNTSFEEIHGWLHATKGGHLNQLSCSVNDPVFWLVHSFVDMIWNSMRNKYSDPAQQLGTYPKESDNYHDIPPNSTYDSIAYPFTDWTCEDGLKVTSLYGVKYVTVPNTCTTDAQCNHTPDNPKAFYCFGGRCITKTRLGGACFSNRECFREAHCKRDPVCLGVCIEPPVIF